MVLEIRSTLWWGELDGVAVNGRDTPATGHREKRPTGPKPEQRDYAASYWAQNMFNSSRIGSAEPRSWSVRGREMLVAHVTTRPSWSSGNNDETRR